MAYLIITTSNSRRDIQHAIDWENKRKPGIAQRFLEDLEHQLSAIARTPYIFSIRYENVYCAGTDVFQYLIHYIVNDADKQVIVLRVLHTSRKPIW